MKKKNLKEKTDNYIDFLYLRRNTDDRYKEEIGDNGPIKRAFSNWNKLRTPAYYKQSALLQ